MTKSDFVANVLDLLRSWGGVSARRMFGGYGLYRQGVMFALVADDVLYLKVDDRNRGAFETSGLGPFAYDTKSGPITIASYFEAPSDVFDDHEAMLAWARGAFEAALRAKKPASPGAKRAARNITKS